MACKHTLRKQHYSAGFDLESTGGDGEGKAVPDAGSEGKMQSGKDERI